jgi:hypothetical protein
MSMVKRELEFEEERIERECVEQERLERERFKELIRLRTALREAISRLKVIAAREEDGPVRTLYKRWEMEARQALEGV